MTITAPDFDYLCGFLRERSAIVLEPGKEYLAVSRLEPVAREAGLDSLGALVAALRLDRRGPLSDDVVDAMTTNETSWYRDLHPFETFRTAVLPDLLERRRDSRSLSIWSAACSSGQEPYTIAMTLRDAVADIDSWNLDILATDLSPKMVERTTAGRYSQIEINRGMPARLLVRHFERDGLLWQVAAPLRRMVRAKLHNLAEPWPPMGPFDVVFLRNVLIYFDVQTKREILREVRRVLKPDGYLLLGGAETTLNLDESFERFPTGKTVWYRPTSP